MVMVLATGGLIGRAASPDLKTCQELKIVGVTKYLSFLFSCVTPNQRCIQKMLRESGRGRKGKTYEDALVSNKSNSKSSIG
jgi:hypothetical protein